MLKFVLENDPFCHAIETLGENVKPGADALKQTSKAIIYGIYVQCNTMHQHYRGMQYKHCLTTDIIELPHVTIAPFYTPGECTTKVSSGTDALKV